MINRHLREFTPKHSDKSLDILISSESLQDNKIAVRTRERIPARRIALVHDWLTGMRGGEIVLEELCRMFPSADIFTLNHHRGKLSDEIEKHRIFESPIPRLPCGRKLFRAYLPLFPWAIESFDLNDYDLVISSSHCVAKGVIPAPDALHVSYIHTPMRYVWDIRTQYLGKQRMKFFKRGVAGFAAHYLRSWDVESSTRVDKFVANSRWVSARIRKYYRRDSTVIYPPVKIEKFTPGEGGGGYFLTVSAFVPYKRVDLAIEACNKLGKKLIVVGAGPELKRLKRIAGKNIQFIGGVKHDHLSSLYREAEAIIYPALEDFGIVPVEAQACGRPVIAYGRGGVLETVVDEGKRRTGMFFPEQTVQSLVETLRMFDPDDFDPKVIRKNSERFNRERFIGEMTDLIESSWQNDR